MLLNVQNLATHFFLDEGRLKAVDNISFNIHEKETLALVGESGCGKTIVALSLLNLVPLPGSTFSRARSFKAGHSAHKPNSRK